MTPAEEDAPPVSEVIVREEHSWTKAEAALITFVCLLAFFTGILLLIAGLSKGGAKGDIPRTIITVCGLACFAMVIGTPIAVSRRFYEVRPSSFVCCNGLRTHRAMRDDIHEIGFRRRSFGTGGLMWTGFVELKGGRSFWIRRLIAGSPSRSPVPMPKGQAKMDQIREILEIPQNPAD